MDEEVLKRLQERMQEHRRDSTSVPKPWPPPEAVAKRWESHGMECCVARGYLALCGYVKVPVGHPAHGKYYDDLQDVDVHGGLTFSQLSEDGTWFGFDCAHGGDFLQIDAPKDSPAAKGALKDDGSPLFPIIHSGRIWTVEDVSKEVEELAKQLAEIAACS